MAQTRTDGEQTITFRARISSRNAITVPADVRRDLDVQPGDLVEVRIVAHHAPTTDAPAEPPPSARSLLRDSYKSREDVERFIEEERQGWEERDRLLEEDRKLVWERFSSSGS